MCLLFLKPVLFVIRAFTPSKCDNRACLSQNSVFDPSGYLIMMRAWPRSLEGQLKHFTNIRNMCKWYHSPSKVASMWKKHWFIIQCFTPSKFKVASPRMTRKIAARPGLEPRTFRLIGCDPIPTANLPVLKDCARREFYSRSIRLQQSRFRIKCNYDLCVCPCDLDLGSTLTSHRYQSYV